MKALIEELIIEQSRTENKYAQVMAGDKMTRKKSIVDVDARFKILVDSYKKANIEEYINSIGNVITHYTPGTVLSL
jgi:hypothetical protein